MTPGAKALSPRCANALGGSEKAQRQWQLEAAFRHLEQKTRCGLVGNLLMCRKFCRFVAFDIFGMFGAC